jgi:hypothetical protein
MSNTKGTGLTRSAHEFKPTKKQKKENPPPPVQQTDDYQEPPTTDTVKKYFLCQAMLGRPLDKKFCIIIRDKKGDHFSNVDTLEEANSILKECRKRKILNEKKKGAQRFAFPPELCASCNKVYFYADGDTTSKFFGFHTMIAHPKEEDEEDKPDETDKTD